MEVFRLKVKEKSLDDSHFYNEKFNGKVVSNQSKEANQSSCINLRVSTQSVHAQSKVFSHQ